jgi:tripartite-type tricarboxylate transporter receptor subunit TctC
MRVPFVMAVNPSFPATNLPEFIAYAKANPGKISMASPGNGTPSHVSGEQLKMMTGIDMVHVPYRGGGPALTDLLGGQVQVLFAAAPGVIEHVRTNKLRALAVTGAARLQAMPNIPTVGEFIPDFEASLWLGLGAPANTPKDLIETLNGDINAVLMDAKIKTRLSELGGVPMPLTAVQFGKLISDETEKWAKVIRFAGLKPG